MKRRSVKVIRSRLEDVEVGDVVNRSPDAELGWFTVDAITTLFNGHLQLADVTEQLTVSGDHKDMVGLQLVEEIELDDRGLVVSATPTVVTTPPPPTDGTWPSVPGTPAAQRDSHASQQVELAASPDLSTEAAVAAEIATGMEGPSGGGPHVPDGVSLTLVAELLEGLDVGEAPAIADGTEALDPRRTPASSSPVVPEGARPVYGAELPTVPSYKNPVVVPEGDVLPRRGRAA